MSTLMPDHIITPQFQGPRPTWLWPNRIPLGKITLLAGDPGLGKSFLALDIAARLSTGRPMPAQDSELRTQDSPAATLLFSAEDELHDTILPRLAALHADLARIHPLRCLDAASEFAEPFSLKTDLYEIGIAIQEHDAKLIILDPITAFMDGIDQNSTAHIRQHLTPLAQLAAFYGVAILAITHLNKELRHHSLHRATGSLALAAIARTVHLVYKAPSPEIISLGPPSERIPSLETRNPKLETPAILFSPLKSNLSSPPPPLPFRIHNNTLEWLPHPPAAALGAARPTQDSELSTQDFDSHDRQTALHFLKESLADGPQPAIPLIRQAKALAISERTLKRAKAQLGILSQKDGLNRWLWLLPN